RPDHARNPGSYMSSTVGESLVGQDSAPDQMVGQERSPDLQEHYLVSHGKSGGVGSFVAPGPMVLCRGDRVVIDGPRGREAGTILCPANIRQARLLGAMDSGSIVRSLIPDDEAALAGLHELGQQLFDFSR